MKCLKDTCELFQISEVSQNIKELGPEFKVRYSCSEYHISRLFVVIETRHNFYHVPVEELGMDRCENLLATAKRLISLVSNEIDFTSWIVSKSHHKQMKAIEEGVLVVGEYNRSCVKVGGIFINKEALSV